MHASISEVLSYFDEQRAELERVCMSVPSDLRMRHPGPDRWSVAGVVWHVAIVERQVIQLLQSTIREARASGLGAEAVIPPVIPTVDVKRLLDRDRKIEASRSNQPPADPQFPAAWYDLQASGAGVRSLLLEFDGLALSEVVIRNPVLGPLNGYQWIVFLGGHEARHALQVAEVGAGVAKQAGAMPTPTVAKP